MIIIILPAYNEEKGIERLLKRISEAVRENYKVILVDDGSDDRTFEKAFEYKKRLPLEIVRHKKNMGLGQALKSGILKACEISKNEDIVITMDADNTHNPELISIMEKEIKNGNDIIIASRYTEGGKEDGLSIKRKMLSRCASTLLKMVFSIKGVKDYTSGYRAYSGGVIKKGIHFYKDGLIKEKGFGASFEILLKLSRVTKKIKEIPLILQYNLKIGRSKIKILNTIFCYLKLIGKEIFNKITM